VSLVIIRVIQSVFLPVTGTKNPVLDGFLLLVVAVMLIKLHTWSCLKTRMQDEVTI